MSFEGLYRDVRGKVRRPPSEVELGRGGGEGGGSSVAGTLPGEGRPGQAEMGWVTV